MLPPSLRDVLADQDGVVARRQIVALGFRDHDVSRWMRGRELTRLHSGVYLDHTGQASIDQRQWAAVLACWPAALVGMSALDAYGLRPARSELSAPRQAGLPVALPPIQVGVEHPRKVRAPQGVVVRRVVRLSEQVQWHIAPPRQSVEHAVLSACAAATSHAEALAVLADVVGQRRTSPARLVAALDARGPLTHGAWLRTVLDDTAAGVHSSLEWTYLDRVERRHRLPTARRQLRSGGARPVYRDAAYDEFGVLVELDGRLGHEWTRDRWADMDRDLRAGADGLLTLRLGWRHVMEAPCDTARRIALTLRRRGWSGAPRPCSPECTV